MARRSGSVPYLHARGVAGSKGYRRRKVKDKLAKLDGQIGSSSSILLVPYTCFLLVGFAGAQIQALAGSPAEPGSDQLHPALEMTLFARDPDVVDPVALTWDEEGRMYVVEMRDYPYGIGPEHKPGGTIRL